MSKSLIYLIGIFALWFYFHIADTPSNKRGSGFKLDEADKAQSGSAGTKVTWGDTARGGGFTVKPNDEIGGSA